MSTTPRTDAAKWKLDDPALPSEVVLADFARTLETETIALRAQIHDLCHDKHLVGAPVTPQEFCNGCEAYQMKLFGESPIAKLRETIADLIKAHETVYPDERWACMEQAVERAKKIL